MTFRCSSKSHCDRADCTLCHKKDNCLHCSNAMHCPYRSKDSRLYAPRCHNAFPGNGLGGK